ncbi:MAG: hypothetical protein ACRDMX_10675 [Solirubrobacteraceae bacterium]
MQVVELLRDPGLVASGRRMAERARAQGPEPDAAQFVLGKAVAEHAGAAVGAGVAPESPETLAVVAPGGDRTPPIPRPRRCGRAD